MKKKNRKCCWNRKIRKFNFYNTQLIRYLIRSNIRPESSEPEMSHRKWVIENQKWVIGNRKWLIGTGNDSSEPEISHFRFRNVTVTLPKNAWSGKVSSSSERNFFLGMNLFLVEKVEINFLIWKIRNESAGIK